MTRLSITARITLWYAIVLVAVSTILMVVLFHYYDIREQNIAGQQIMSILEDISDRISTDGKESAKDHSIDYQRNNIYISVYDKDGAFFAGKIPDGIEGLPGIKPGSTQTFKDSRGHQWLVCDTKLYTDGKERLYVRGIAENTNYRTEVKNISRIFFIAIPILVLIALAGGWIIAKSAFRPIRELTGVLNEIKVEGDLSKRVPVPENRSETGELTGSINGLFDTIEEMVDRERQFASDVSHELRTPLSIIRTQSEYALEDPGYTELALMTIIRESRHMGKIITDLLTISRSNSGRLRLEIKDVDIRRLLSELTEQAKMANADSDTDIVFVDETGGGELTIESDEDLLMRILLSLIENAVRHGKSPGGHVEIRLRRYEGYAVIIVVDDGEGIAAEEQDKVWNRFYQAEGSRSRKDSSGLGLAMAASLTKAIGGSIRIIPDEEKRQGELPGAVFKIDLPMKMSKKHTST